MMDNRCIRMLLAALVACAMALAPGRGPAQEQPQLVPLFFTGLAGGDEAWGRRVLLRWDSIDGLVELENAVIFRTGSANVREKIAVVRPTRSAKTIESIFHKPGEERILDDARDTLERIYGDAGATPAEFAQRVVDLLDGTDKSEYAGARRNFAVQSNYGFAIVEGLGYLDFVDPQDGPFVYELWQGDAMGNAVDALGRITIDASNPQPLPPPGNLHEVFLKGRDGVTPARGNHRRIYLNWESTPELRSYRTAAFGYNIYKLPRALEAGEDFDDVRDELVRINRVPILEPSPIEGEDPDQTYIYADDGGWLQSLDDDDLLVVGAKHTYWAVARDLMGNEGLPSNALEATVRDTEEPDMPKGISVFETKDGDLVPFLRVQWRQQSLDTATYRVYRYREYANAGKKGPFDPVDGMTEGLIAEVPNGELAPDQTKVEHDDYEANQAPRGTGFWYCISAVDAHGNESALSPAAYGVIEDVVGPEPGRVTQFCVSRPILSIGATVDDGIDRPTPWSPKFVITRLSAAVSRVRIGTVVITPGKAQEYTELAEFDFRGDDAVQYSLVDPIAEDEGDIPIYRFTFEALDGSTEEEDVPAPATWTPGTTRKIYRLVANVIGYRQDCDPFGEGVLEAGLVPVVPGGDAPPLDIAIDCASSDAESYRLYRSVDGCRTYQLVHEVACQGGSLNLTDNYHPEAMTEACYSIVAIDKNGNLGPPKYLDPVFLFVGKFPAPTLVDAMATGLPGAPTLTVRWIGPKAGVLFYRVHFIADGQKQGKPLEFPINSLDYDEQLNEFMVTTDVIDRDGTPVDTSENYEVAVEAVTMGSSAKASDKLPFTWSSKKLAGDGESGTFRWAFRPLPPVVEYEPPSIYYASSEHGVVIRIKEVGGQEAGIPLMRTPETPFMVWRQRTDKSGQPFAAVSPMIQEINFAGEFLNDPFFALIEEFGEDRLFFVDNSGHVQGATYRYIFMEFDPDTGEIVRLRGPFSVDIVIPG